MATTGPIGMIGLGLLGGAIAERLMQSDFPVVGYDVDPERRDLMRQVGVHVAADAPGVVRSCDRLILSLPTSDVVRRVIESVRDGLRSSQVIVDTTTGRPQHMAELGERLASLGVHYLDASIAGSSEQARQGGVVALVGGEASVYRSCSDLFACFAARWFHVGPNGAGARLKLVHNLLLGLHRAVLAEGLRFAGALGFDPAVALSVLIETPAYSRVMDTKGPKMIAGDFSPQARLSQHLKDVRLILAEGELTGAALPLSELHRALLEKAEAAGFGPEDNSAVIKVFDREIVGGL